MALTFGSNLGGELRITIPRANTSLTGPEVEAAMLGMKNSGALLCARAGIPTSVKRAELIATARTPLVTPE
jgi:hypothetical protein